MSIKLGTTSISDIRLGSTQINKVCLGSTEIYGNVQPVASWYIDNVVGGTATIASDAGVYELISNYGFTVPGSVKVTGSGSDPNVWTWYDYTNPYDSRWMNATACATAFTVTPTVVNPWEQFEVTFDVIEG